MKLKLLILIIIAFASNWVYGQNRQQYMELAEKAFDQKDYRHAYMVYKELADKWDYLTQSQSLDIPYTITEYEWVGEEDTLVSLSQELPPQLVVLKRLTWLSIELNLYKEAEEYGLLLVEKDKNDDISESGYLLGIALMQNMKYEEAEPAFKKFLDSGKGTKTQKEKAEIMRKGVINAYKKIQKDDFDQIVTLADTSLNRNLSNFALKYNNNETEVFFASTDKRQVAKKSDAYYLQSDLFTAKKSKKGYSDIEKLPLTINSNNNEGSFTQLPDGSIVFTKWDSDNDKAIYIANRNTDSWIMPRKLGDLINMPGFQSKDPYYDSKNGFLYFSSDKPGGKGGFDIWRCRLDDKGNPVEVMNLGKEINSADNEVSPFYHANSGTLYFSSDVCEGYGGYDIYRSNDQTDKWGDAVNLGYPVNSGSDDLYFVLDNDESLGYLTSDRERCKNCYGGGCNNIYEIKDAITILITGQIFDAISDNEIPEAEVTLELKSKEGVKPVKVITDAEGNYSFELKKSEKYYIGASKADYLPSGDSVTTMGIKKSTRLFLDLYLLPSTDEEIVLEGILYDFDKWDLLVQSKEILNTLVNIMYRYPTLVIELASHTDNRGSDEYNQVLSQKRAESCVKYLIQRGIDKKRLVANGYGESKPLIEDAQTEEEHQLNRRTTFRIISKDFNPKGNK